MTTDEWKPEEKVQAADVRNQDKEPVVALGAGTGVGTQSTQRTSTQDARARYWRLLFDNLKRAVGDIYSMCESDGDIAECKEAIMVLHNRIKEFEGLIQYIEVQTSYETSDERPSSVAWQVPVSAIKQPTIPFQPNGDPTQLYYYPNYPMQTYQPYSVPGGFPMMDLNFLPYPNQPGAFPTFPPEFIPPSLPPPPNQFPPWQKFENHQYHHSGSHKNERPKNNNRRNKNDTNYKTRKTDSYQNNHKQSKPPALDTKIAVKVDHTVPVVSQSTDTSSLQNDTTVLHEVETTTSTVAETSTELVVTPSNLLVTTQEPGIESVSTATKEEEIVECSDIHLALADAIDDKSSDAEQPQSDSADSTSLRKSESADWQMLEKSTSKDEYIHVNSEGSDHSVSPDIKSSVKEAGETEEVAESVDLAEPKIYFDLQSGQQVERELLEKIEKIEGEAPIQDKEDGSYDSTKEPEVIEPTKEPECTPAVSSESAEQTAELMSEPLEPAELVNEPVELAAEQKPTEDPAETSAAPAAPAAPSAPAAPAAPAAAPAAPSAAPAPSAAAPSAAPSAEAPAAAPSAPSAAPSAAPAAPSAAPSAPSAPAAPAEVASDPTAEPETTDLEQAPEAAKTEPAVFSDPAVTECDALSESGMSTSSRMSSGSSMSLPSNPLMRSTSWAELVRKGKSDSPPAIVHKRATTTKYNSTPSRYLSHTTQKPAPAGAAAPPRTGARTAPKVKRAAAPPIAVRSRSRPPFVTNPSSSEKTEDGWKVSSGRSRVKISSNSPPTPEASTAPVKPESKTVKDVKSSESKPTKEKSIDSKATKSPQSSPRLTLKSSTKSADTKSPVEPPKKVLLKRPARASSLTKSASSSSTTTTPKVRKISKAPGTVTKTSLKARSKENLSSGSASEKTVGKNAKTPTVSRKDSITKSKKVATKGEKKEAVEDVSKDEEIAEIEAAAEITEKEENAEKEGEEESDNVDKSEESEDCEVKEEAMLDKEKTMVNDEISTQGCQSPSPEEPSRVTKCTVATSTYPNEQMYNELFYRPAFPIPDQSEGNDEDRCSVLRVMMSRKRQISDGSSMSGGTEEEERGERKCSSPGRSPGKAPQLHQRLSSPSRRRNATDTLRLHNERLAKAQLQRDKIQEEKAVKLQKIKIKEEQVKDLQEQQEKERIMKGIQHAEKLQRAETLRLEKIQEVKKRAHEEEHKVNEIAFINSMEAENRKMELMSKEQMAEEKQKEIQEERRKKVFEQQAREGAVMERKQCIEAERLARIALLEGKRKETLAKVNLIKLEKDHAREEAAKEKARERERKIGSAHVDKSELEQKIVQKHKDNNERQLRQLEFIREKAAMMCVSSGGSEPEHALYETPRWCTLCSVKIISEAFLVSHMTNCHKRSSKSEAEKEAQYIVDYTEDLSPYNTDILSRQKMLRKRTKKVKTRLTNRLNEIPDHVIPEKPRDCSNKNRILKCIKAINTVKGLEKGITDLNRTSLTPEDFNHLIDRGVVDQIGSALLTANKSRLLLPVSQLLTGFAGHSPEGSRCCMRHMSVIIEELSQRLTTPDACTIGLLNLTTVLLRSLKPGENLTTEVISFLVSKYVIDTIQSLCLNITQLKDEMLVSLLVSTLQLVSACCDVVTVTQQLTLTPVKCDMSQLGESILSTDLCGVVTLLYGVLLYDGPPRQSTPPPLTPMVQQVVTAALSMLLSVARFNLYTLQTILDKEPISQELRHVCSYLLWGASQHSYSTILDQCIELIGYSTFSHPRNQLLLQNGSSPTILQLLCALPLSYFSAPESMDLLFPTLISACHNSPSNLAILQQKVNKIMLVSYIKEKLAQDTKHVRLFPAKHYKEALAFLES